MSIGYTIGIAGIGAAHTFAAIYVGGFNTNVVKHLRDPSQRGRRPVLVVLAGLGLVFSVLVFMSLALSIEKLGTDPVTRVDYAVAFVSGIVVSVLAAMSYEKWVAKA